MTELERILKDTLAVMEQELTATQKTHSETLDKQQTTLETHSQAIQRMQKSLGLMNAEQQESARQKTGNGEEQIKESTKTLW